MTDENVEQKQDSTDQSDQSTVDPTYFEHKNVRANRTEQSIWSFGGDAERPR
jgi:hypothetical protein